jgi:hypothetical protein
MPYYPSYRVFPRTLKKRHVVGNLFVRASKLKWLQRGMGVHTRYQRIDNAPCRHKFESKATTGRTDLIWAKCPALGSPSLLQAPTSALISTSWPQRGWVDMAGIL